MSSGERLGNSGRILRFMSGEFGLRYFDGQDRWLMQMRDSSNGTGLGLMPYGGLDWSLSMA
jgi:hypothetical protein